MTYPDKTLRLHLSAMAVTLLVCSPLQAADKYQLKLKSSADVGQSVRVSEETQGSFRLNIVDAKGKLLHTKTEASAEEARYDETVLVKSGNSPSHYRRNYLTATETKDGGTRKKAYQGRVVDFLKKGDDFLVRYQDGGAMPRIASDELMRKVKGDIESDEDFLPDHPVSVGESWTPNLRSFSGDIEVMSIDLSRSTGSSKLVEAYERDGRLYGVIETSLRLTTTTFGQMTLNEPAPVDIVHRYHGCLDGGSTEGNGSLELRMNAAVTMDVRGRKTRMRMAMIFASEEKRSSERRLE